MREPAKTAFAVSLTGNRGSPPPRRPSLAAEADHVLLEPDKSLSVSCLAWGDPIHVIYLTVKEDPYQPPRWDWTRTPRKGV